MTNVTAFPLVKHVDNIVGEKVKKCLERRWPNKDFGYTFTGSGTIHVLSETEPDNYETLRVFTMGAVMACEM